MVVGGAVVVVVVLLFGGRAFGGAGERDRPAVGGSEEIPMSVLTALVARNAIAAATRSAEQGEQRPAQGRMRSSAAFSGLAATGMRGSSSTARTPPPSRF